MNNNGKALEVELFGNNFDVSVLKQIVEQKLTPSDVIVLPEERNCRMESFYVELIHILRRMKQQENCKRAGFFQLNLADPEDMVLMGQAVKAGFIVTFERYEGAWVILDITR